MSYIDKYKSWLDNPVFDDETKKNFFQSKVMNQKLKTDFTKI